MSAEAGKLAFWALVAVVLCYDFLNGLHDSGNVIATVVVSGSMDLGPALWLAALGEFAGPFLFGTAVASSIGRDTLNVEAVTRPVLLAAVLGALVWTLTTWLLRIPSSSSHALIGGLVGSAVLAGGWGAVRLQGVARVLLSLFLGPPLGWLAGYLVLRLTRFFAQSATPRVNQFFRTAQVPASLALALSHGTNDSQKTMALLGMVLLACGRLDRFAVPGWAIAVSAGGLALGTLVGGFRAARTLGTRIVRIRPLHGFSAQVGAATVILAAALLGGPVSTTHVIGSAIAGSGAAERFSRVRWGVFGQILTAWLLTVPTAALVAAAVHGLLRWLGWA
ncbi:MAG: anion permease [Chloroflexia bacterium]